MVQKNDRIQFLDIAKGIGILCIVMGHVIPNAVIRQFLYAFHVPVFFILSGYTYRLKPDAKAFFLAKCKRLLIPYYAFSIISILIFFVMSQIIALDGDSRILPNILGMLYANSNTGYMTWNRPLWFLPCMFCATLLLDGFERFLHRRDQKSHAAYRLCFILITWLLGIALSCFIQDLYLPFHFESAVFLVGFSEVGILAASIMSQYRLPEKIKSCSKRTFFIFLLCSLGIAIGLSAVNGHTDIRDHRFGSFPIFLILTALILSALVIAASIRLEHSRFLTVCGTSSLAILLMHKFPILFFQEVVPYIRNYLSANNTVVGTLCGFLISALTILMCLIAEWIILMICPMIVGKTKQQ